MIVKLGESQPKSLILGSHIFTFGNNEMESDPTRQMSTLFP